jgi:hypothetical protein
LTPIHVQIDIRTNICKKFSSKESALISAGRLLNQRVGHPAKTNASQLHQVNNTPTLSVQQKLNKAETHGRHTWSLIEKHRGTPVMMNILYQVAITLETHILNLLILEHLQTQQQLNDNSTLNFPAGYYHNTHESHEVTTLKSFYKQPAIQIPKKHRATSIYSQLISKPKPIPFPRNQNSNSFFILGLDQEVQIMQQDTNQDQIQLMEEDEAANQSKIRQTSTPLTQRIKPKLMKKWEADPSISQLSATFLSNLQAIQLDPTWKFPHLKNPPIMQLTRGEFRSSKKSQKMIFVHAEKSKQQDVAQGLTKIYDGTSKAYPNGNMMLFIPLRDNIQYDALYRQKVVYNHEQFLGEEMALAIHGLQDLDSGVKLKNGQTITIRMLIRGLPATQGMSRPQLFQPAETNASRDCIITTYQKSDKDLVIARLYTLENDIRAQLAEGEAENIFISEIEGIWFTQITKTKSGQIVNSQPTSKFHLDHIQHMHSILSSPPKKRQHSTLLPTNNGSQSTVTSTTYSAAVRQQQHNPKITITPVSTNATHQEAHSQSEHPPSLQRLTEAIDKRFQLVENDLQKNREWQVEQEKWNVKMSDKMQSLESTTSNTDNKVDMILSKLDSWDIPTKRRGVTTTQEERNAPNPHLLEYSGATLS